MSGRQLVLDAAHDRAWLILLVSGAVLACACIALLFRYERQLIPARLGRLLLALRLAAVAVIFLVLLEPELTTSTERVNTGRFLVAVDLSESMDTVDKSAPMAEKLRLARALGLLGNELTQAQLDRWIEAYAEGRDPEWVTEAEEADPTRAAAIAEGRRLVVSAVTREVEQLPRSEIARRLLVHGPHPVLKQLQELGPVDVRVFAGESANSDMTTLETHVVNPPEALDRDTSDLAAPLSGDSGAKVPFNAIILLSDGRDTSRRPAEQLVSRMRSSEAPVYPVLVGSEQRSRDLAVLSIDAPATVYENDQATVEVQLRTAGFEGQEVQVTLAAADAGSDPTTAEPAQLETIVPAGETAAVRFTIAARESGRYRYVVRAAPYPEEVRDDNNERDFALQIVDDQADVLLLDGEARWEFRYLQAALARDERVELDVVLFEQPYLGLLPETFFPRRLATAEQTGSEGAFAPYDAVLVGDVSPQQLPPEDWRQLDRYVREQGGTLVLLAGRRSMPLAFESEVVAGLLPVEQLEPIAGPAGAAQQSPGSRGFRLRPTPDGESAGVLLLDEDAQRSRVIWDELPGHTWGLRGRARPGCTVWATVVLPGEGQRLESERANAVIAHQFLGAGQVIWVGIDSTWRWRHRVGDRYHHRFWGQLVRSAVEFKAAVQQDIVQFGPERASIAAGETALFRAQWSEVYLRQHPELIATVKLTSVDGSAAPVTVSATMQPLPERAHVREAAIPNLPPGEYRAELVVENAAATTDDVTAELSVVPRLTPELQDVTADRALLERIAEATGGEVLSPEEFINLPRRLQPARTRETLHRETALWDHWSVILVFCCLVGMEWVLRKLNGLP